MYVNESWMDEQTGVAYRKGYYDENGTYYDADTVAFKKPDGSYEAHYVCEYCGTELEANWKEGFYTTCKNCGSEMNKTPVYIDEIIHIGNAASSNTNSRISNNAPKVFLIMAMVCVLAPMIIFMTIFGALSHIVRSNLVEAEPFQETEQFVETEQFQEIETNLEIYGNDIYLDEISPNIYSICTEQDEYEKHITWDYGAQAYYDYDSDCYLWYNTDVSPNLWQYWYDDIAGDNYYGWMECEGDIWYIEISDTEWEEYQGDTTPLWHIENPFDQ